MAPTVMFGPACHPTDPPSTIRGSAWMDDLIPLNSPYTHTNTISKNATKDGITLGPLSNMRRTSTCMLQGCRGKIGVSDINGAKQTHMQRQNGGGYHQNHCNSNLCSGVAKVKLKVQGVAWVSTPMKRKQSQSKFRWWAELKSTDHSHTELGLRILKQTCKSWN